MSRPDPSELAAAGWIIAGVATTVSLQRATAGEHSVTRGLRRHPVVFALLVVLFWLHVVDDWP